MFDARVKLYMDWAQDENRRFKSSYSRRSLLLWMNKMTLSNRYEGRNTNNLVLMKAKQRYGGEVDEESEFLDDDPEYHFAGTSPSSLRRAVEALRGVNSKGKKPMR